jgi:hypothetical protein
VVAESPAVILAALDSLAVMTDRELRWEDTPGSCRTGGAGGAHRKSDLKRAV